jgi:response regulator RpfG family c-di-GMP phosphodiesterase
MSTPLYHFIIIDDDPFSNKISSVLIRTMYPASESSIFTIPEQGFKYITSTPIPEDDVIRVILLDINMPGMSGWEFLEHFEQESIRNRFNLFIISSSIDVHDLNKSKAHPLVIDFISKPISREVMKNAIEKVKR